ncbi:MAG TPA: prepilin-type N-terminal cleavage/methylation domain-containing protein [Patescibacteria group bacterium]|nr:prepilin-type N-terminal cleavage/methylation domain-containing protein [Patescibacteria group bacterium]
MRVFQRGFTLIELLVVVGVIGILSYILIAVINPLAQLQRGRDLERKANISSIQTFLEQYRHDVGNYPAAVPGPSNSYYSLGTSLTNGGTTYMSTIPGDPSNSTTYYNNGYYYYNVDSSSSNYVLIACLENTQDTSQVPAPTPPTGFYTAPTNLCTNGKLYVVTNQ